MALNDMLHKKIGFVRVEKPHLHHETYEVAAWFTDSLSDVGDYDMFLTKGPNGFSVYATLDGTVTNNCNVSLFAGVAYGENRSEKGRRVKFQIGLPIEIVACGERSPVYRNIEFILDRNLLDDVIAYAEEQMNSACNKMPYWLDQYKAKPRSQFNSEISMVAYIGEQISRWGRVLETVLRQKESRFGSFQEYEKVQSTSTPVPAAA